MGKIWTEQEAQQWIDEHYPGAKFISFIRYQEGDQNRTDATITCVECGDEFTKDWHSYRSRGSGRCQKCSRSHGGDWHRLSDEYLRKFPPGLNLSEVQVSIPMQGIPYQALVEHLYH